MKICSHYTIGKDHDPLLPRNTPLDLS